MKDIKILIGNKQVGYSRKWVESFQSFEAFKEAVDAKEHFTDIPATTYEPALKDAYESAKPKALEYQPMTETEKADVQGDFKKASVKKG